MKQLERTYVTAKQFKHKQSQKIHKIAILIRHFFSASEMTYIVSGGALNSTHSLTSRALYDALTYTMTHYTKLFKS